MLRSVHELDEASLAGLSGFPFQYQTVGAILVVVLLVIWTMRRRARREAGEKLDEDRLMA